MTGQFAAIESTSVSKWICLPPHPIISSLPAEADADTLSKILNGTLPDESEIE
ncbi:hypothetical protein [Bradyrhizobium sp. sGM-13]|uniref:hypothetical protein n=1 Tax=Bradyrhizobium sp. sGM-13 TaxID=2831781 RepID=UPI001BD0CA6B|nr:hypothetical protein [Bradyrhizobium sp. sGM-13]